MFNFFGNFLDQKIQQYNIKRNQKKYANLLNHPDYELMMRSTNGAIKSHEQNQQSRILKRYQSKMMEIEKMIYENYPSYK